VSLGAVVGSSVVAGVIGLLLFAACTVDANSTSQGDLRSCDSIIEHQGLRAAERCLEERDQRAAKWAAGGAAAAGLSAVTVITVLVWSRRRNRSTNGGL
jgi:hypothetical protein